MQGQREGDTSVVFENSGEVNVADRGHGEENGRRLKEQAGSRSLEIPSSSRP